MKKLVNRFFYTALYSSIALTVAAQSTADYLRAADRFFKDGDYYSASQYYEKYLTGKPGKKTGGYNPYVVQKVSQVTTPSTPSSRKDVVYNLAESYRMINYYSKAEPYYREAANMGPVYPLAPYWHAKCQRAIGNLDSAEVELKAFQATYTAQDDISKDVQKELNDLSFIKSQKARKDLARYNVNKSANPLNTVGANYAPFFLADGTLTFTSTRNDTGTTTTSSKNPYTNKVYQASSNSTIASEVQKLNLPPDSKMEQGVAAFTPDGSKMFVTKWVMQGRKKMAAIYSSNRSMDSWTTPVKLPATINAEGASTQQPFVTDDGKYLLFSSDRTGGSGKFDVWYVALSSSFEPSAEVKNMGNTINTSEDDEAPFYHLPSQTLIIASNGRTGMGGYDLYYSKGDFTKWETPTNMGQPVNSVKDDIYYASSDKKSIWNNALFSSDRDSPCCLEMYAFDRKSLPKIISGTVVDCSGGKAVPGASITITDAGGKSIATKTTDATGNYMLTMEEYQALKVSATATGYNTNSATLAVPTEEVDSTTSPVICLTLITKPTDTPQPGDNEDLVFDNALFGFDKSDLTESSKQILNRVVDIMNRNPGMTIKVISHTDNFGSEEYNQALSEKRAMACIDYLVEKGIDSGRLTSEGMGETKPIADNTINGKDNPAGRAKNRRTEFKISNK
jgi:OmpA-OmpF porin, OOP family